MIAFSLSIISALFAVFCVNQASFEQLFNLTREHRITTTPWKYFGYSLLLQKGDPPRLIVGAPKAEYHGKEVGSVFRCDLKTLRCFEYNVRKGDGIAIQAKNGNFLGAILDGNRTVGGSIFTCASRLTQRLSDIHYLNGRCYRLSEFGQVHPVDPLRNMPLNKLMPATSPGSLPVAYYEASFGQAGFDMRVTPDGGLLLGVPGMVDWSGAVAKVHLNRPGDSGAGDRVRLYPRYRSTLAGHYSYLGYAVAFGRFKAGNNETWYVAGEPRGFDLKGRVVIFSGVATTKDGMEIEEELLGQDYGAYFGSSLLVLASESTGADDLFVGAPMYGGQTWDEGCVYFYKNSDDGKLFKQPVKLFGEKRMGARFGTVLVDLGDVNLDGIREVAIAAPYENDGIGAVYVYHSSIDDGSFSDSNYERISPMSFTKSPPKGFGLGISNANDVFDGALRGYNAIAIGAYKTGEVFIIPPLPSVAIHSEILPNTTTVYSTTTTIFVRYCVWFENRNGVSSTTSSSSSSTTNHDYFDIVLEMTNDRIVNGKRLSETMVRPLEAKICREHIVLMKPLMHSSDVGHLVFELKAKLSYRDNFTHANTVRVPFSKECDSECHTDLYVIAVSNKKDVLVGVDQKVEFNVTVGSTSGTAFDVQLLLTATPTEVELVNLKNCYPSPTGGYVCPISDVLATSRNLTLVFNVGNVLSTSPYVTINLTAVSHFHDINPGDNEIVVGIPVVVINEPYIEASNDVLVPSTHQQQPNEMPTTDQQQFYRFHQTYSIRNYGPSPLDGTISVFVPEIEGIVEKTASFFEVDVFGSATKEETRVFGDLLNRSDIARHVTFDKVKAIVVQCPGYCTQLVFPIVDLKKTSGFIRIKMKFQVSIDLLAEKYPSENVVAFVTNISVDNGTAVLEESAATLIFGLAERRRFPWYIALLAVFLGVFVLAVIIYVLWKFDFFKREFHYKMHNDQGIIEMDGIDDGDSDEETASAASGGNNSEETSKI